MATAANAQQTTDAPAQVRDHSHPVPGNDADIMSRLEGVLKDGGMSDGTDEDAARSSRPRDDRGRYRASGEQEDDADEDDDTPSDDGEGGVGDDSESEDDDIEDRADDDSDADDDEEPSDNGHEDLHDYELSDGRKIKVPREVAENSMRHAHYTQSMQELGQHRDWYAAQLQTFQIDQQAAQTVGPLERQRDTMVEQANALRQQLTQIGMTGDSNQYREVTRLVEQLDAESERIKQQVEQTKAQLKNQRESAVRELLQTGNQILSSRIPNWGEATLNKILSHAQQQFGYSRQELENAIDPRFLMLVHASMPAEQQGKPQGRNKDRQRGKRGNRPKPPVITPNARSTSTRAEAQRREAGNVQKLKQRASKTGREADAMAAIEGLLGTRTRR